MSNERSRMGALISADVERHGGPTAKFLVSSFWKWELYREGTLLWEDQNHNVCTDEGLNRLLDVMFHGTAATATWYVAIFESNTTPLTTHTYAVPGYTESSAYTEGTRQEYVEGAASGKQITNSSNKATFSINATKTIYGGALVSLSTKADTAGGGVLYCSSQFSGGGKSVTSGDTLKVTITLTAADV